jgi:hypothetical protein
VSSLFTFFAASCNQQPSFFSLPTWYKYLGLEYEGITQRCEVRFSLIENGVFNGSGLLLIALAVIDILIRIAALVAVAYVIYGGFQYMTSQASPEGTKAAQSTILNAVIGLVIAVLAAAIVSFIGFSIGG